MGVKASYQILNSKEQLNSFECNIQDDTSNTQKHKQIETLFDRTYFVISNGSVLFMKAFARKYPYLAKIKLLILQIVSNYRYVTFLTTRSVQITLFVERDFKQRKQLFFHILHCVYKNHRHTHTHTLTHKLRIFTLCSFH
jgi:hypothetical protein